MSKGAEWRLATVASWQPLATCPKRSLAARLPNLYSTECSETAGHAIIFSLYLRVSLPADQASRGGASFPSVAQGLERIGRDHELDQHGGGEAAAGVPVPPQGRRARGGLPLPQALRQRRRVRRHQHDRCRPQQVRAVGSSRCVLICLLCLHVDYWQPQLAYCIIGSCSYLGADI
jgi:hypothetical protein